MKTQFSAFSRRLLAGVLAVGSAVAIGACAGANDTATDMPATEDGTTAVDPTETEDYAATDPAAEGGTVVDVAASNGSFNTLVAAIEAAELTEVLSDEGPYTVFAPTDEAFAALPEGTVDQLLLPENKEALTQILTYHVIPDEVMAAEVTSGEAPTVAGTPLTVTVDETTGAVTVNDATVVTPDVAASNGVIHVIDQVLLPPDLAL